ncbi:Putative Lipoamide Acyltransferase [Rhizopus microsporus]|nr:Putative Lipoamide Acyltransferase [Rhizopus microsporus]
MYLRSIKSISSVIRKPLTQSHRLAVPTLAYRFNTRFFHTSRIQEAVKPFLLADIGEGITECEVIQWFVEPGSEVNEFDKICEVQSDKASVEISSRFAGKVLKLHYDVHDIAKVGHPLVDIETSDDEDDGGSKNQVSETKASDEVKQQPPVANAASNQGVDRSSDSSVLATPAVRHLAKEKNIDLTKVTGTGKDGRVLKEDVLAYAAGKQQGKDVAAAPKQTSTLSAQDRAEPLSMIQKAMFKSMTQSLSIPQLGYKDDIELDATTKYRAALNQHIAAHPHLYPFKKITYLPIFVKCLSIALSHYPIMNAKLEGDMNDLNSIRLVYRNSHNVGIAMDTPQGLIVPNVKDVQSKTVFEIASEIHRLQELAKSNSLPMSDLKGTTITISNIGVIGGTYANPVVVSSELAIVALGRMQKLPRFDEHDNVVAKQILPISWSADHRIIDGATIARFGNHWKNLIENPALLASELR